MGWTSFHVPKGTKTIDVLRDELGKECVVDGRVRGGTAYLACRWPEGRTAGVVVLVRRDSRSHHNFTYKVVDEDMGPYESDCPKAILDLLDPPATTYAAEWRARCVASVERRERAKGVVPGTVIRLAEPLNFTDGWLRSEFRFVTRSTFLSTDGVTVRLTNWRARDFEIVSWPWR